MRFTFARDNGEQLGGRLVASVGSNVARQHRTLCRQHTTRQCRLLVEYSDKLQGPDLHHILRQSYDYGRLIYNISYKEPKAFLRYDSPAKS